MKAIILAGGLGTRLKPFTEIIPKPLLPIGESSVLEIQILSLKQHGIKDIFIATNYRAEYVEAFLGNGEKLGVRIQFSKEREPLGTCGPVSLIRDQLTEPFLLMNGDVLTTLDFSKAAAFAERTDANLTVMTREIVMPFQFGKIVSEGDYIVGVEEKPDLKMEILAGIYIFKPPILEMIPRNTYYGMDTLIKDMIASRQKIAKYPIREYWLDIGRVDDYQVAQTAYKDHFAGLKDAPTPPR
jgi:NDP-sugar pyrophosphorylase family protein